MIFMQEKAKQKTSKRQTKNILLDFCVRATRASSSSSIRSCICLLSPRRRSIKSVSVGYYVITDCYTTFQYNTQSEKYKKIGIAI